MTRTHRLLLVCAGLCGFALVGLGMGRAVMPTIPVPVTADTTWQHTPDSAATGAGAHPDASTLALWSEAAGVPAVFTYAVAWAETRHNTNPRVRGQAGEWGRFQIMPATARARCPQQNVQDYYGNLACFLKMAKADRAMCGGWWCAARIHNGRGPQAEAYADGVMTTVQTLVLREVER